MRLPAPPPVESPGRGGLQGIDEQVSREAAAKRFRTGRAMSRLRRLTALRCGAPAPSPLHLKIETDVAERRSECGKRAAFSTRRRSKARSGHAAGGNPKRSAGFS